MFAFIVNFLKSLFTNKSKESLIKIKWVMFGDRLAIAEWGVGGCVRLEEVNYTFKVTRYNGRETEVLFYSEEGFSIAPATVQWSVSTRCVAVAKKEVARRLKQLKKEKENYKKSRFEKFMKGSVKGFCVGFSLFVLVAIFFVCGYYVQPLLVDQNYHTCPEGKVAAYLDAETAPKFEQKILCMSPDDKHRYKLFGMTSLREEKVDQVAAQQSSGVSSVQQPGVKNNPTKDLDTGYYYSCTQYQWLICGRQKTPPPVIGIKEIRCPNKADVKDAWEHLWRVQQYHQNDQQSKHHQNRLPFQLTVQLPYGCTKILF